jgi:hypothetical protein
MTTDQISETKARPCRRRGDEAEPRAALRAALQDAVVLAVTPRPTRRRALACMAGIFAMSLFLLTGCGRKDAHENHDHPSHGSGDAHEHIAPHGGTVVVLGNEQFHLEFVRDAAAGTLTAYVLDAHLENFVRLPAPGFQVVALPTSNPRPLEFHAVASPATGETVGDTAQFEARAEWLRTTTEFDALLTSITVRGTTFSAVKFNFPQGNESE